MAVARAPSAAGRVLLRGLGALLQRRLQDPRATSYFFVFLFMVEGMALHGACTQGGDVHGHVDRF